MHYGLHQQGARTCSPEGPAAWDVPSAFQWELPGRGHHVHVGGAVPERRRWAKALRAPHKVLLYFCKSTCTNTELWHKITDPILIPSWASQIGCNTSPCIFVVHCLEHFLQMMVFKWQGWILFFWLVTCRRKMQVSMTDCLFLGGSPFCTGRHKLPSSLRARLPEGQRCRQPLHERSCDQGAALRPAVKLGSHKFILVMSWVSV